jgi:S1-C subfamily serine protease
LVVHEATRAWDAGIGSGLGVLSVLLVAWMVAVPLASSPYPGLSRQADHSSIVRAVDNVMPDDVRQLYSSLRSFLDQSGFPRVFGDLPLQPIVAVPPPPSLSDAVRKKVIAAEDSIFKITAQAPSCNREIEGSGFLYARHYIVTNAHVVAGSNQVSVRSPGRSDSAPATVTLYDPQRDIAILYAPGVSAAPLPLASRPANSKDPAVIIGYPENGPYTADTARVRSRFMTTGSDIYGDGSIRREVYSIRGTVRSGNSGGPLIADDGSVLGVIFERAIDSSDTGYALTLQEIKPDLAAARGSVRPVGTGKCATG